MVDTVLEIVNNMVAKTAMAVSDSDTLYTTRVGDQIHFDANGQINLGNALAQGNDRACSQAFVTGFVGLGQPAAGPTLMALNTILLQGAESRKGLGTFQVLFVTPTRSCPCVKPLPLSNCWSLSPSSRC